MLFITAVPGASGFNVHKTPAAPKEGRQKEK